jgi:DNA-binding protein H-NS
MLFREPGNKRRVRLDCLRITFLETSVARTVDQIRERIAKLQAQERALLQKEALEVIKKIKVAVEHYGITAEQIFGPSAPAWKTASKPSMKASGTAAKTARKTRRTKAAEAVSVGKPKKAASASKGIKVAPKYKDGEGNSWSGRGSQPRWLRAALEGGKTLQDFAVA